MLLANRSINKRLSITNVSNIDEFASLWSEQSIDRYINQQNTRFAKRGVRFEYDGKLLRCLLINSNSFFQHVLERDRNLRDIAPLRSDFVEWIRDGIQNNVIWWQDLQSVRDRYSKIKLNVTSLFPKGKNLLENVPVTLGMDWEFNAWACPAKQYGDFIAVNLGFITSHCYTAMFIEALEEAQCTSTSNRPSGIITSSMIWMAASVLGYEARQWDNLSLPENESDKMWARVQNPPKRLSAAIYCLENFAMLHECGHIACGHLQTLRKWMKEDAMTASESNVRYKKMRDFEFEADAFACQALLRLGYDPSTFFEGLLTLFSMLRLCEDRAAQSLTSTHPAASERFKKCLENLNCDPVEGSSILEKLIMLFVNTAINRVNWQNSLIKTT